MIYPLNLPLKKSLVTMLSVLAMQATPSVVQAASCTWNPVTGNWSTASDWSCGSVPTGPGADTANIGIGQTVTIDSTQSIFTLNNAGDVDIDAFLLTLQGGGSSTNTGTINVGGPSTAALQMFHQLDNTGGTINITNGSALNQFSGTLTGGTINTSGTGALIASNSSTNFLDNVTINGTLDLASNANARERIQNGLTLNGTANINSNAILSFEGTSTLDGNATIIFGATGLGNRLDFDGNGTTTLDTNVVVRGENGTIGNHLNIGGTQTLVNNGLISADVAGGTIRITDSAVQNNNLLEARNNATLDLRSDISNGASGVIRADNAVVQQTSQRVTGGTITTANGGVFRANSSAGNFLDGTTIDGTLDLTTTNARERVVNGLTLNGTANINSNAILSFEGNSTFGGNATVIFGATGLGNRLDLDGDGTTILDTNVVVRGENGTIGNHINIGGTQTLVNNGVISADVASGTIVITDSAVQNNNLLEARNNATLDLRSDVSNGASGVIHADNAVVQQTSQRVTGGTITTANGGVFRANASAINFLDATTVDGTLDLTTTNARERIVNGLTLNGTVNINNNGSLSFEGTQTLAGTGTINFGATGTGNSIDLDGTGATTIGSNITIRGEKGVIGGQINIGGTQTLINNGLISADVAGGTITITDSAVTNNGILEAKNGATLLLQSNVDGGASGLLRADASSSIIQSGVTLSGDINTSGTFSATSTSTNFLDGVTLNGDLDLTATNARERVTTGGLTHNGTIQINNNASLSFAGDGTLTGNSTIVLGNTGSGNRVDLDGSGTTIFDSNVTVRGENGTIGGQIFVGGTQTLVNNGRISADVAGGLINITDSAVTNNGILEAKNGATLKLSSNVTGGASGQIIAGAGSTVQQNGITITGVVNTLGNGDFVATSSAANFLTGVTLNGDLNLTTTNARERVNGGGLTHNGTINIDNNASLSFDNTGVLDGNSTLVFGAAGAGNRVDLDGSGTTTFGSNVIVRGENGTIGNQIFTGGTQTLINNGLISADVLGGKLTIIDSEVVNNNTLEARNGATLDLRSNVDNSSSGVILADNGVVVQTSQRITGGAINSANGGSLQVTSSSVNFLDNTTINGTLDMSTNVNTREQIENGLTVNGNVSLNRNGIITINGTQTIDGTGSITLGDTGAGNRLDLDGTGTTTIGAGLTIQGENGTIGLQSFVGGTQTLVNNGLITANVAGGTLNLTQSAVTNNGTLLASAGTMNVQVPLSGTGNLEVSGTGQMNLTGGPNTTGNLLQNSNTAGSLNIGTQDLTVTGDYNNANFGTGNSFDKRANIAGSGQILAAAGTAQGVSGTTVTDGATATPTLSIGNVRVGSTATQTFQVDNLGTGSTLRGAIQTSGGGAAISDARLNVAAQNYDAVAPGASSAPITVSFDATSSGLLSLSGTNTLGIVNNFDNVAGQLLNITTASGAAAYDMAAGNATPSPVVLANQRVGGTASNALTVTNTTAAGAFTEALNADFSATNGQVTNNGGSISLLAGGASDTSSLQVGVDTSSAGAKTGSVTLNYASDGTGTSGLSAINVGTQTINVSGDVYRLAQGSTTPTPVNFGNRHVGDITTQALTVTNTAAADGFSESLNVQFAANSGSATNNGAAITQLAAGDLDNSTLAVGLDTSSAGAKSGRVNLNYSSDGAGTSGLGTIAAGSQSINISGNVYRLAAANALADLNFGNVHVGDTVQQALNITNTALNDGFSEKLNASFGASSDARITTAGSINQLNAGSSDSSSMQVGLDTSAAGVVNGTQVVNFASDGSGTSGLGITALAAQTIGVSGNINTTGSVFRLASASPATPNPVDFGNVRIGSTADQALSITNTAANDGFSEKLNASISTNGAPVTASGSFNLLGPQATDSTSLHVGLDTSSAGAKSGNATIALVSDGTGTSNLGTTNLASQTVNVSGNVYRLANPTVNTTAINLAARVGDLAPSATISVSNSSPDSFTEGLNASFGAAPSPFVATGSITNLAAQGTDAGSLNVSLDTSSSSSTVGTATVDFVSTGAGTTGAADVSLGSSLVNLAGKVYQQAVAQLNTLAVDFGIVHKGDIVSPAAVSMTNAATVTALNDVLQGSISSSGGAFAASGNLGAGVAAGATDNTSLSVNLNTGINGVFNGTATVALFSHNDDLADLGLGDTVLSLSAQVNEYANAELRKTAGQGSLSRVATDIVLDFGNLLQGSGVQTATLDVFNDVIGPADLLDGLFNFLDIDDFSFTGFTSFADLAAGDSLQDLMVSFDTSSLGSFSDTILLRTIGHNSSGYSAALNDITLSIRGNVFAPGTIPEPKQLLLLCIGLVALLAAQRRRPRLQTK